MRIDEDIKVAAEKAAAPKGIKSLTESVVWLIEMDSARVNKAYETVTVNDNVFDRFIHACDAAEEPNQKLRDAAQYSYKHGAR